MRERAKKGDLPVLQLPCSVSVTRFAALSCDGCDSAPALAAACNGTETPQNVLCKLSLSDYVKSLSTHPKLKHCTDPTHHPASRHAPAVPLASDCHPMGSERHEAGGSHTSSSCQAASDRGRPPSRPGTSSQATASWRSTYPRLSPSLNCTVWRPDLASNALTRPMYQRPMAGQNTFTCATDRACC